MSTAEEPLKPSQIGDCPECHHRFPNSKVCPGGPFACGGERENCPRCPKPVPTTIDPPAVEPITDELPNYREPNGGV